MVGQEEILDVEKIYPLLFESAAEGLIVIDSKGEIQIANPRIEEMFGYKKDEIIGKKVEIFIPEKYRDVHKGHRDGYYKEPAKRTMGMGMDLMAIRKDRTEFPVEISLNHFKLNDKTLVMALITDITERKKADYELQRINAELEARVSARTRELKKSQELYSIIARNFPNGTINVFDRELKYIFVEGMELFKFGITSDKLVGTSYIERLDPEIRSEIEIRLKSVFEENND